MITVTNLTKEYRDGDTVVHALRGVSMEINQGEFISIAGPSGSGKTTLLNLIGCIDTATAGSIVIDGRIVAGSTARELSGLRREKLGFVFQSFNLIPVLTAFENIAFSLTLQGVGEPETRERTMAMLAEVGLEGLADRLPSQLSGGQQQRVAIARALVKRPTVVLADEPTANLDSRTGKAILELMAEMNRRHNSTFVFSTHDQMVMDMAGRLTLLHDGEIVSDERRSA